LRGGRLLTHSTFNLCSLSQIVTSADYADVLGVLNGLTSATLFAPNNAAIRKLLESKPSVPTVKAALQYHLLAAAKVKAADLQAVNYPETALAAPNFGASRKGYPLVITKDANGVNFKFRGNGTAKVVSADVESSNGVIHMYVFVVNRSSVQECMTDRGFMFSNPIQNHSIDSVLLPPLLTSETAGSTPVLSSLVGACQGQPGERS
jgi:hypothetical protein